MPVARDPRILPEPRPEPEALNVRTPGQSVVGHKARQVVAGKLCAKPAMLEVLLYQTLQELALTGLGRTPGAIVPEVVAFPAPVAAGTDLVGRCHSTHAPSRTLCLSPGCLLSFAPALPGTRPAQRHDWHGLAAIPAKAAQQKRSQAPASGKILQQAPGRKAVSDCSFEFLEAGRPCKWSVAIYVQVLLVTAGSHGGYSASV